jgi:NADH:ubiquinone oxidoreductase subunit 5 (subunit L)/multisubunit Na+/H+ antiporter MnhA subunit
MSEMAISAEQQPRARDRLAAAFLLVVLGVGTVVLWIGIPTLCLWAASKVTNSIASHFLVATPVTLVAMGAFVWFLYWVDRLYLRVTGAYDPSEWDEDDEDDEPRILRGPLEPMLIASLVLGIIALFVWFFAFAENPSSQVI